MIKLFFSLLDIHSILICKFISEVDNTSRFSNVNTFATYVEIDSVIRQSGDKYRFHLSIFRKENKHFRAIFHLMISSLIQLNREPNAI